MFVICRSSTRIRSNRRAMPVDAFSAPSLRRSASRAPQPGDRVFHPARAVRSPRGAGELALQPGPLRRGQGGGVRQVSCGQGRGDRHPPVNSHHLAVTGCRNRTGVMTLAESPQSCSAEFPTLLDHETT